MNNKLIIHNAFITHNIAAMKFSSVCSKSKKSTARNDKIPFLLRPEYLTSDQGV